MRGAQPSYTYTLGMRRTTQRHCLCRKVLDGRYLWRMLLTTKNTRPSPTNHKNPELLACPLEAMATMTELRFGYKVEYKPVGEADPVVATPKQTGVFPLA